VTCILSCLPFPGWLLVSRKRKQSGLLLEEEEDGKEDSGGSSSEEDEEEQEGGLGSENARKKKEDELWASFLNDVGPKSKAAPGSQTKVSLEFGGINTFPETPSLPWELPIVLIRKLT
jgi:hypothetical protein